MGRQIIIAQAFVVIVDAEAELDHVVDATCDLQIALARPRRKPEVSNEVSNNSLGYAAVTPQATTNGGA